MSVALLLAMQASAPAEDILVEGIRAMRMSFARDPDGNLVCRLGRSTGVNAVDARLCDIARSCARKPSTPLIEVGRCVDRKKPQLIAELKSARGKPKDRLNYHAVD